MTTDPFLPFFVCPAADGECYVVRGRRAGPHVEVSLSLERRQKHHFSSDAYALIEVLAVKRLPHAKESSYMAYASNLEDAARCAARGELGYHVHTVAEASGVRVSLVSRLIGPDGHIRTEIADEYYFDDPDSHAALVQANEKATELRVRAEQLNSDWIARRRARVLELQTEYGNADADTKAALGLQGIIDAEKD